MNPDITSIIQSFSTENISAERKEILEPLADYIRKRQLKGEIIRLNFICTHNSRRSHLSQIWAQTIAHHFGVKNILCYSGGTESTAMFLKITETLSRQGFNILKLSETSNPVYAVKYAQNEHPIICFSKEYNHGFNPSVNYAAIVTCNSADAACPIVFGAEARFSVNYDDPKAFDGKDEMDAKYAECSLQIGEELLYVFKSAMTHHKF